MAYISQYEYYENNDNNPTDANWGSYQYVSLNDIVNNFLLMHTGNHSLINNEERYKVIFHAKRAIQELNYDAFKEVKVLELSVADSLRYVLPSEMYSKIHSSPAILESKFITPAFLSILKVGLKLAVSVFKPNAVLIP